MSTEMTPQTDGTPEDTSVPASTETEKSAPVPRRISWAVRIGLLAVALGLIAVAIRLLSASPSDSGVTVVNATKPVAPAPQGPPRAGSPLPAVEVRTLDGGTINLGDLKGKQVIVNFWATWCPPCKAELPDLARTYQDHQADGLQIVGIDVEETEPVISRYLRDIGGLPYPVALDVDGKLTSQFAVVSLPTSLFVDNEGIIRLTSVGGMNYSAMQHKLQQTQDEQDYAHRQAANKG